MLDLKLIREQSVMVQESSRKKNCEIALETLLSLDADRRNYIQEVEKLKQKLNNASESLGKLKRDGQDISSMTNELKSLSQNIKKLDGEVGEIEQKISEIALKIPNIPHESVPDGGPEANEIVREWGEKPAFDFEPKDHLSISESMGYINMSAATKITGSGFVLYKDFGARLERALINFMIDFHAKRHGYREVSPPFVVNRASMIGTGQLPKLEDDMYKLKDEDFFLIPTGEVPVTNIHRDEIILEHELPIKYVTYTPCFRREAGSYGKDTRGLSRVHQFDKVELVKFVKPDQSFQELELLVNDAEAILQALELPYRVVLLAAGDLSFAASKCYDLEVWAPASKKWFEVSSCSNFCDFQARRANIKYRKESDKKTEYVHTLNGSGVALARIFLCLLENFQQKDATICFPKQLEPYLK